MLCDDMYGFEGLVAIEDGEELCRRLLGSPGGWGSSTRHGEAVEVLARVHGSQDLPASFVALMLCTCRRWDRVTARLIAAIEESGLLCDVDLDEVAGSLLSNECVISYPLAWVSPRWLDVDLSDGSSRVHTVDGSTLGRHQLSFEPPLRRWAARRRLRADRSCLGDLLTRADQFEPRHRDALIHGLLDAAAVLEEPACRRLVRRGLRIGQASVRRTALDRLCELDGPEPARRRARADGNASVRRWQPQSFQVGEPASLFES